MPSGCLPVVETDRLQGRPRRTLPRAGLAAAIVLFGARACLAHDFWIEPQEFRPEPGSLVTLRLRVGQEFVGDSVPRNDDLIDRFVVVGAKGEERVLGADGSDPAGVARIDQSGALVIGYRSLRSPIELEASRFEKYLADEGLDAISAARAKRGDSSKPGREVFSRCAKALLQAGGEGVRGFDRAIGFTLELVPESNPYALNGAGKLPVKLLYDGKPLPGALIVAMNRDAPGDKLRVRSNPSGLVTLRLDRPGVWLVKAVHMVHAPAEANADWESFWASLTFEIPQPAPPAPSKR